MGLKMKILIFCRLLKNPIFRGEGGFKKNPCIGGNHLKPFLGGWAICRFKGGGLGKKEGGGWYPNAYYDGSKLQWLESTSHLRKKCKQQYSSIILHNPNPIVTIIFPYDDNKLYLTYSTSMADINC